MDTPTLDAIAADHERAARACEQATAYLRTAADPARQWQGARSGAHVFAAHEQPRRADGLFANPAAVRTERSGAS